MTIIAETLRSYRKSKRLSQAELARNSGVSKKTISRIELGEISNPNRATKKRLASALDVKAEDLAKDAAKRKETERFLKQLGYRSVRFHMDSETAHAFRMIQYRYGVPSRTLIMAAPLLMAVLAESSLQWRKNKVNEIHDVLSAVRSITSDAAHLVFAKDIFDRSWDAVSGEEDSIGMADIFGRKLHEDAYEYGLNLSAHNPFADYLRHLCREIDQSILELDPNGLDGWKADDCIPDYRIIPAEIERLTCGDIWAEFAIERGHVRISDIPDDLIADGHDEERVAWITAKIPEDARREQQDWLDSFPNIDLD